MIIRLRFQEASQGIYNDSAIILRDLERLHAAGNSQRPDSASGDISPDQGYPATSIESQGGAKNRATSEAQNMEDCHVMDSSDLRNEENPVSVSTPPFILNTASKRRAEVERILSTPEGARMSLRQVAGMAGVSPTTAGSIKKKMAASAQL
ncbi:MAG: hypothetical protein ABF611_07995 [Acetobacter orientalis]|uniref:hypothetical protein n=1 Tax=Acetobacter orientalis TaxID=146474 RepID=UPI0039E8BC1E